MAANDSTMNIVVKAKNETEATFNKVKSDINGVKTANESMATSVFKGVASWDLLKTGITKAVGFLKESITASMQAEREMALVRQNVENAGVAFDSISGKLEEYSKNMMQMGFDDEETATSVSKLLLVTKDYEKALQLNNLAADLARSKGIALSDATSLVTQVTAGNTRVLKQYGIVLEDGASAADALAAMQDKVKGSMEAFAETTEGKMQIMSVTWGNFKEQIGDIFGPALNIALTNFNSFLSASTDNSMSWADKMRDNLATLVNPEAWKLLGASIKEKIETPFYNIAKNVSSIKDKIFGTKTDMGMSPEEYYTQKMIELEMSIEKTTASAVKLKSGIDSAKPSFEGIGKAGEDSMKKQKDAMTGVLDKLKDYKQGIKDIQKAQEEEAASFTQSQIEKKQTFQQQLADMVESHKTKWQEANREISRMEREGIKNREDLDRVSELKRTSQSEFDIIQPYLNDTSLTKLAQTSDVERLISAYRSEQATETVASSERQAGLVEKATNIYMNFDLKDTAITDKNFIQTIKDELNKALNLIRSTN